jgi:hypothetical protein
MESQTLENNESAQAIEFIMLTIGRNRITDLFIILYNKIFSYPIIDINYHLMIKNVSSAHPLPQRNTHSPGATPALAEAHPVPSEVRALSLILLLELSLHIIYIGESALFGTTSALDERLSYHLFIFP